MSRDNARSCRVGRGHPPVAGGSRCPTRRRSGSLGSVPMTNSPAIPDRLTRRPHRSCRPYWRAISRPLGSEPSSVRLASAHCHACRRRSPLPLLRPPGASPCELGSEERCRNRCRFPSRPSRREICTPRLSRPGPAVDRGALPDLAHQQLIDILTGRRGARHGCDLGFHMPCMFVT